MTGLGRHYQLSEGRVTWGGLEPQAFERDSPWHTDLAGGACSQTQRAGGHRGGSREVPGIPSIWAEGSPHPCAGARAVR
jgi:hypothetical protein